MGVLLLIGLVFSAAGLFFLNDYRKFRSRSGEKAGKLVAVAQSELHKSDGKVDITYHPIIEYSDGSTWQFRSPSGFKGHMPYRIGDTIALLVDKNSPRQVRVKSKDNFYVGVLLLILGLELSVVAGADLLFSGSYFYLIAGIGVVGLGISKLKSTFNGLTAKLQGMQSSIDAPLNDMAWETTTPPSDAATWLYDLSTISDKGSHAILGLILLLVGSIALGGGGYWLQQRAVFVSQAENVPGQVTRIEQVRSTATDRVETSYYPVVAFTTLAGQSIEFRSDAGNNTSIYGVGDNVRVYYLPAQPDDAFLDRGMVMNFAGSALLFSVGGMLFFIGIIVFRRR